MQELRLHIRRDPKQCKLIRAMLEDLEGQVPTGHTEQRKSLVKYSPESALTEMDTASCGLSQVPWTLDSLL